MLPPPEGPRGPLEQEMLDALRASSLGSIAGLNWAVEGSLDAVTDDQMAQATLAILNAVSFAVLRLAREIDELRA